MAARNFQLIASAIEAQLEEIDLVWQKVLERQTELAEMRAVVFEGTAFVIHNYYSATEDLLRLVATAFENNITDVSRWHSELIDRMTLDIEGIRPALLSKETALMLHRLRSFRHFIRHAYKVDLDPTDIQVNIDRVIEVHPLVTADVQHFLAALRSTT